jgi:formate dehydrogenase iron-sulfur subunit
VFEVLVIILVVSSLLKLASEAAVLLHVRDAQQSTLKRAALLMLGDLAAFTRGRFWCGAIGGLAAPVLALLLTRHSTAAAGAAGPSDPAFPLIAVTVLSFLAFALTVAGELLERTLFFAAAPASRMPGGIDG